jgi:hypothetical protein
MWIAVAQAIPEMKSMALQHPSCVNQKERRRLQHRDAEKNSHFGDSTVAVQGDQALDA